ncbi:transposase [Spirosoma spitsbergense]|uniref:transposase n=1 Tax=Spirosoma spitsbergense TaxID=431554 RepID=UPI00316AD3BB
MSTPGWFQGFESRSIQTHYPRILNYFDNRSTNASAESFNARSKRFVLSLEGFTTGDFFCTI